MDRDGGRAAKPGQVPMFGVIDTTRAKHLPIRAPSPVREEGRRVASETFRLAVVRDASHERVARALSVSPTLVKSWSAPGLHQQLSVADVVALHVAGEHTLVLGYLADVRAWCEARTAAPGLPRLEHVTRLSASLGAVAQTARDPHDRAAYVASLHRLARAVEASLADERLPRVA